MIWKDNKLLAVFHSVIVIFQVWYLIFKRALFIATLQQVSFLRRILLADVQSWPSTNRGALWSLSGFLSILMSLGPFLAILVAAICF